MKRNPIQLPEEGITEVLLHACCAPCSSAIVEWMLAHDIRPTIYYYNPNIYPQEEYIIRKEESKRHAESLRLRWVDGDYSHDAWRSCVVGMENEPERGSRCLECFKMRMLTTARQAQALGMRYFTTTLASSRWKSIEQITAAGMWAQEKVNGERRENGGLEPVSFWSQNWRKGGLSDRRNQLLKLYGFYNQQYCGCEYSMRPTRDATHGERDGDVERTLQKTLTNK